jgi:FtsZ-binding cell division protein ZapB
MAGVAEYDGYLEFDNDQVRESFVQLNENVRALQGRLDSLESTIASTIALLQAQVSNLEATKANEMDTGTTTGHTHA